MPGITQSTWTREEILYVADPEGVVAVVAEAVEAGDDGVAGVMGIADADRGGDVLFLYFRGNRH